MGDALLQGKKIAVLVESEYIPEEIEAYRRRFSELGAEVHLMSRLWGCQALTFYSGMNQAEDRTRKTRDVRLQFLEVDIDFETVDLDAYAAVIIAANYVSVRLRYPNPPPDGVVRPDTPSKAPAVEFFAEAMQRPKIVKGALCHGLWILTPRPDLLAGRKVTCHENVLADVVNAGAVYIQPADQVVVDDDLVTGRSVDCVVPFIDAIAERIVRGQRA
jgi:protease I